MIKARIIKVTSIENKQIILITIMRMRIKIGNRINI